MFAALLVICSATSSHCEPQQTEAIFPTEQVCNETVAEWLLDHGEEIKRAFGPYVVNLWCRQIPGRPV